MELDTVKPEPVTREFLAVVISGFGNELVPLTSDYGDEPCPKSLLPVANKPLLEYVLIWIEKSGIKDVLLICPASHRSAIYHHIHSDVSSSSLRIDLQSYDETQSSNTGTCELLRHFSSRITEDFVVVPCDWIPPPTLPLSTLLNKFRVDSLSDGSIATACWYPSNLPDKSAFPEEWGPSPPSTPIIWDDGSGTLLHIDTPDDLDKNSDELIIKMSLLNKSPRTKLSSRYQDSHVYVCRRSALKLLQAKLYFSSMREDFLPWLCKIQYQRAKKRKYSRVLNAPDSGSSQKLSLRHSTLVYRPTESHSHSEPLDDSAPPSPTDSDAEYEFDTSFRIGLVLHRQEAGYTVRVNTIPDFYEVNKRHLSGVTYTLPSDPKDRSLIDQKAQISNDTIIGESTQVSERTTIKKSVIGRHCVIGKMVKISGCILLDHCRVEDGAKLENCVLGKSTKVGSKAELSRCVTQAGYDVAAGETVKGEKLEVSDWTAEIDSDAETAPSDESDG